jgi:hypothetical protein
MCGRHESEDTWVLADGASFNKHLLGSHCQAGMVQVSETPVAGPLLRRRERNSNYGSSHLEPREFTEEPRCHGAGKD